METEPPAQLGTQVAFVARFLGRRLAYTYEFVEFEPPTRVVMRTADGPFPMETTYEWRDEDDGATHMTLRNRGAPSGFSRVMAPFMAPAMRRANHKDLAALQRILRSVRTSSPVSSDLAGSGLARMPCSAVRD
jgi:hypothetical protein